MNTQTTKPEAVRISETEAFKSFKQGVDDMLEKRRYFTAHVMPVLVEKQDYHVINGRKVLSKGGAEKLASIYNLTATFEKDSDTMSAFGSFPGLIAYTCNLTRDGQIVGQGRGAYCLGKDDKDVNKAIKMSQISAFRDACIRTTGLSDIFTQDLEAATLEPEIRKQKPVNQPATEKQQDLLRSLIYRNIHSESEQEKWLAEIPELDKASASDMISSFVGVR